MHVQSLRFTQLMVGNEYNPAACARKLNHTRYVKKAYIAAKTYRAIAIKACGFKQSIALGTLDASTPRTCELSAEPCGYLHLAKLNLRLTRLALMICKLLQNLNRLNYPALMLTIAPPYVKSLRRHLKSLVAALTRLCVERWTASLRTSTTCD